MTAHELAALLLKGPDLPVTDYCAHEITTVEKFSNHVAVWGPDE